MSWNLSLYRRLIKLYPKKFRQRYGDEMVQWFEDELSSGRGSGSRLRFWGRILSDLFRSVVTEHAAKISDTLSRSGSGARPHGSHPRHTFSDVLTQDLRVALRSYARTPTVFLVIVTTMAVSIGFVTTVYSVVDGVLLAPLPYPQSERLVRVGAGLTEESGRLYALSMPEALHLEEHSRSFESMAVSRGLRATLHGTGEPELHAGAMVSWQFFDVLGIQPFLGRTFLEAEDQPGAEPVVILDHGLWTRRFGADPNVLGEPIRIGSTSFTIIGVLPEGFHPPEATVQSDAKLWISLSFLGEEIRNDPINHFLGGVARLASGVSPQAAQAELEALDRRYVEHFSLDEPSHLGIFGLHRETVGTVADSLLPLFGAVALLLLIACSNIATLLLIRSSERGGEMALRGAIGAPRARLVRQLLTESLLLGAVGGVLGVVIAFGGVELFRSFSPGNIPRLAEVAVDGKVLLFSLGTSLLAGLVFGLAPALRGSRLGLGGQLNESRRGSEGTSGDRLKSLFVVAEIAVAFVLVVGAGLLMHSFVRLHRVDLGFDPANAHVLRAAGPQVESGEELASFYGQLTDRLEGLPGVVAVGGTSNLPMSGRYAMRGIEEVQGRQMPTSGPGFDEDGYSVYYQYVTPGFFQSLEIPLLRGRSFAAADSEKSPAVAILNQAAARDLFGGDEAVGGRFRATDGYRDTWFEVVGVVADSRQHRLEREAGAELYLSLGQALSPPSVDVIVRTDGPVAGIMPAMREEFRGLRSDLPIRRTMHFEDFIADSAASPRFFTIALGSFAGVALLLALVGIHGVLSYSVSERAREIGIRRALGAGDTSVLGLILRKGTVLVGFGLSLGIVAALASTRVLETLIFGIEPTDLTTLVGAVLAVTVAALSVSLLPAWRATRIDPRTLLKRF